MTDTPPHDATRSRLVTWGDPMIGAAAAQTMSGMDYLQALLSHQIPDPPISRLIGMELIEISAGRAVFTFTPAEFHYNPIGSVHGGIASTLLDSALGCVVQTMMPAGVGYTTLGLHVNFVRALTRDTGLIRCEGEVIHVGRTVATAQARLLDGADKLYGHATTTCIILRPEGESKAAAKTS